MDLSTSVDYPEVYPVVTPNLVLKAALGLPLGEPLFGHPDDSEVGEVLIEEDLTTDTVPVPVLGGKRLRGSSDYSPTGILLRGSTRVTPFSLFLPWTLMSRIWTPMTKTS